MEHNSWHKHHLFLLPSGLRTATSEAHLFVPGSGIVGSADRSVCFLDTAENRVLYYGWPRNVVLFKLFQEGRSVCPSLFISWERRLGKLDIDISEVKKLVELVETYDLEELKVEQDDLSITVKGRCAAAPAPVIMQAGVQPHVAAVEAVAQEAVEEPAVEPAVELEGNIVDIVAPLVGVFYRAPAPDAPVFVEVGDTIEVGSEIGLIEAMKVFSPIPSEVAGVVVDVTAPNGKLGREGDVLVRVRVSEE